MKLTRQQFLKALPASALLLAGCAAKQTAPANTEALVFDHAYPLDYARQFTADCYEGGYDMTEDELFEAGVNKSATHVDFMIGTDDLNIDGITLPEGM